ncbi:Proteasome subunit beta type-1 [Cystobasidiomycetes sp. EMM_F5]
MERIDWTRLKQGEGARSGSAADTQAIADIVAYHLQLYTQVHGHAPPVHAAATLFQNLCYTNKDKLSAGLIVAGWDPEAGPSVYNIPLGGGLFKAPWAIGGSGSSYIYGYCDANYKEGWGRDETVEFVKNAVSLAMSRDGSSGGTIRMAVVTKDSVERLFVSGHEIPFSGALWGSKQLISTDKQPVPSVPV